MWLIDRIKKLLLVGLLSALPLLLLYMQSKNHNIRVLMSKPIIEVVGFIENKTLSMFTWTFDLLFRYTYMATRAEELRWLRQQVLETNNLKAQVSYLMKEKALLLGLHFNQVELAIPKTKLARVIARVGAPMARMIRIDHGSTDNITYGAAVISHGGVVGQVISVAPHFSDVLLITDASSALDARIVSTQARGLLRGTTSNQAYLMEIRDIDSMNIAKHGDIVVSSGVNSLFPEGIPIGKVIDSSRSRDGIYLLARVEPLVDMDAINQVLVLLDDREGDMTKRASLTSSWPVATP